MINCLGIVEGGNRKGRIEAVGANLQARKGSLHLLNRASVQLTGAYLS